VTPRGGLSAASTVEWGTGPQPSSRSSWAQQTPLAKQTQEVKSHPTTESWSVTSAAQLSQQAKQPQSTHAATHKREGRKSHDQSREQQQQHWKFIEETGFESKYRGSHQVPCVADKSALTCVTLIRSDGPHGDKGTGVLCLIL